MGIERVRFDLAGGIGSNLASLKAEGILKVDVPDQLKKAQSKNLVGAANEVFALLSKQFARKTHDLNLEIEGMPIHLPSIAKKVQSTNALLKKEFQKLPTRLDKEIQKAWQKVQKSSTALKKLKVTVKLESKWRNLDVAPNFVKQTKVKAVALREFAKTAAAVHSKTETLLSALKTEEPLRKKLVQAINRMDAERDGFKRREAGASIDEQELQELNKVIKPHIAACRAANNAYRAKIAALGQQIGKFCQGTSCTVRALLVVEDLPSPQHDGKQRLLDGIETKAKMFINNAEALIKMVKRGEGLAKECDELVSEAIKGKAVVEGQTIWHEQDIKKSLSRAQKLVTGSNQIANLATKLASW